jgi:hypothetical protein
MFEVAFGSREPKLVWRFGTKLLPLLDICNAIKVANAIN